MLWFFLGFIFGVYVAQESPKFPNVRKTSKRLSKFIYEICMNEKSFASTPETPAYTRSKSE